MFDCLLKFAVKQSLVDWWWWREMLHHLYSKLQSRRAIIDTVIQDLLDKIRLSYEKISKVLIQNQYVNYFMFNLGQI